MFEGEERSFSVRCALVCGGALIFKLRSRNNVRLQPFPNVSEVNRRVLRKSPCFSSSILVVISFCSASVSPVAEELSLEHL